MKVGEHVKQAELPAPLQVEHSKEHLLHRPSAGFPKYPSGQMA